MAKMSVSAFCYLSEGSKKPSSGRKGDCEAVEGARAALRFVVFHCHALSLTRLRRELPPGGSLRMRVTFRGMGLPEARVACNAVIQKRNWR